MEEAQNKARENKAKEAVAHAQERIQGPGAGAQERAPELPLGAGARAQERVSEVVRQNKDRVESAFGLLRLVLAALGAALLLVPDKASLLMAVAFLAFGQRVFKTTEQSATIIKQCASEARHGKVPKAATKGYTWISAPDCPLPLAYEVDLRIIGSAIIGAAVVAALLRRAAAEGVLNERPYKRLIMALFTWAALSAGISLMYRDLWDPRALMVWLAVLGTTAILTGPLTLAQNPIATLQETASEAKDVRTGRGKLFLILGTFFFVEGLGILAYPTLAQRGLSGPAVDMKDPVIGLLFSLVAASAHVIVPAAVFNLKSLSDQGNLSNLTAFMNNTVLLVVAGVHVTNLARSALAGYAGPIAPVLLTAWTVAFLTSLAHFPCTVAGL
ncbi:g2317 [Coccomyxa viridis]|uniref:G2317 protein n=1 Tax=Coccomyxa viridis TaxID=1274662 RepID=A0ABP1FN17_9CHLO